MKVFFSAAVIFGSLCLASCSQNEEVKQDDSIKTACVCKNCGDSCDKSCGAECCKDK